MGKGMKKILIEFAISLLTTVPGLRANACPGFCDQKVNDACDAFLSTNGKEKAAIAAIGVVRAYDSLAAERLEYQSQNYMIDNTTSLTTWCGWATGKSTSND